MRHSTYPRIQLSGSDALVPNYRRAVACAGGLALAGYAPVPDISCQGLLLCGGGDIAPARFGQEDQGSHTPDPQRDGAELALFWAFARAGKPILGICRGMQLINVALGGSLTQDLPAHLRPFHTAPDVDLTHCVRSAEGSVMQALYGAHFWANSAHHQAVARPGRGLHITAWADDGVPEAVEHDALPILGVQFHPERMSPVPGCNDMSSGTPIFSRFISLCRG